MTTLRAALLAAPLAVVLATTGCEEAAKDCPEGQTRCAGLCTDLRSDPLSCGGCSRRCPAGADCVDGGCRCPDGQTACGGVCTDLQSDPGHCGACLQRCGAGTCTAGACVCDPGMGSCPSPGAQCVDLDADTGNCGTCRNRCGAGESCDAGDCVCLPPRLQCTGAGCIDPRSDASNCGACGNVCPLVNEVCAGGECACPAAKPKECNGACVDTAGDEANCGTCGFACAAGASCDFGTCRCPAAQPDVCDGACVDTATDEASCGWCGVTCQAGASCIDGKCMCPPHSNGLGQTYVDCGPLGQHTRDQALLAAEAWAPSGDTTEPAPNCGQSCVCRTNAPFMTASQVAVWCFDGDLAGRKGLVRVTDTMGCQAALCPVGGPGTLTWD
jgi:hypothetical protein